MIRHKSIGLIYMALLILPLACTKAKAPDYSEGQTNWTKIPYKLVRTTGDPFKWFRIQAISFVDTQTGYMTGDECYHEPTGRIYKTTDGGNTWSDVYGTYGYATLGYSLNWFTPSRWIVGYWSAGTNRHVQTTDAGLTWNPLATGMSDYSFCMADCRINTNTYIVHNITTTDAGQTWQPVSTVSGLTDYSFIHQNYGVCATNNGKIALTSDFAQSWNILFNDNDYSFQSVVMLDSNTIMAGGNKIIKSTDGGSTWNEVYTGTDIMDLEFVNANVGFAAVLHTSGNTHSGKILKTTDGGNTWTENYSSAFMGFTSLCVINENTIIAGGMTGHGHKGVGFVLKTTTQGN